MRKLIQKGNSADGHTYHLVKEKNFKLNIFIKFWVFIYSKKNRDVQIFGIWFKKEATAGDFAQKFNYQEEIKKHVS